MDFQEVVTLGVRHSANIQLVLAINDVSITQKHSIRKKSRNMAEPCDTHVEVLYILAPKTTENSVNLQKRRATENLLIEKKRSFQDFNLRLNKLSIYFKKNLQRQSIIDTTKITFKCYRFLRARLAWSTDFRSGSSCSVALSTQNALELFDKEQNIFHNKRYKVVDHIFCHCIIIIKFPPPEKSSLKLEVHQQTVNRWKKV